MNPFVYVVVARSRGWSLRFGERNYGPFESEEEAVEIALGAARIGREANVFVQREDGQLERLAHNPGKPR